MPTLEMFQFKGLRNDVGQKIVPIDYFFDCLNTNQDDIAGFNKSLAPRRISVVNNSAAIDGIFQYSYLTTLKNGVQTIQKTVNTEIIACDGSLYDGMISRTLIYSGMQTGKCQAAVYNDKIFIVNGKDYPKIYTGTSVYEMGAPEAILDVSSGALTGSYYYAMTYVTAGGEEVLGTVSNAITATNQKISLNLPIGYTGTLTRKIYRATVGVDKLLFLATISDNTTLTYTDNIADNSSNSEIPAINNECPKPKFITVSANYKLVGAGDSSFPTQAYITETDLEVWDKASYTDVTNRGTDNTAITGLSDDYGFIIIGSQRQIYFLDTSDTTASVTLTRCNIGILDGYTIVKMPSNSGFAGGVMFIATDRTVRVMNGNYSDPVPTSLDNIKTENFAQSIRETLEQDLSSYQNAHAEYFDYKYHLVINNKIYVFDTRLLGWNILQYITETQNCYPNVIINFDDKDLYIGGRNNGFIERMYSDSLYNGEEYQAYMQSPYWAVSEDLKFFKELHIYLKNQVQLNIDVNVNIGDSLNEDEYTIIDTTAQGAFDENNFTSDFETTKVIEDYKVIYINQYGFWANFKIIIKELGLDVAAFNSTDFNIDDFLTDKSENVTTFGNNAFIRGIRLVYDEISNKE